MITIGICDDEAAYRENVKLICKYYLDEHEQGYQFVEFASGEEVLSYEGDPIHLLFLDIEMPGIDGLEVMERVRRNELIWRIAFVTIHKELQWAAIDLKTLAFLVKPLDHVGVEHCLRTAIRESRENFVISYNTCKGNGFVKLNQIVFIKAQGNYTTIYAKGTEIKGCIGIKTMEEKLSGTTMVRTHKSYLVNLQHIVKMEGDMVEMTNGVQLPVGRKYIPNLKDAYFEFLKMVTIDRNK